MRAYVKLAGQGDGAQLPLPAKSVHPGDTYSGIAPLTARLRELGDLPSNPAGPADPIAAAHPIAPADATVYRGAMVDGVKHFQKRHGLQPDGVLGKETLAQLNVPLGQRVAQLQYALERYRSPRPAFRSRRSSSISPSSGCARCAGSPRRFCRCE